METPLTLNNTYVLDLLIFLFFSKVNSCMCDCLCAICSYVCVHVCMFCRYSSICT